MIAAALYGAMSGLALGLTGGGGSVIAVPILIYGLHLPVHTAISLSLISVFITALAGAIHRYRHNQVKLKAGGLMILGGVIGTPLGTQLNTIFSATTLTASFAILMTAIGLIMWHKSKRQGSISTDSAEMKINTFVLLIAGIATGVLTGLFGVGGGFMIVPALLLAAKLRIKQAMATSLFAIAGICLSGIVAHLIHGNITHLSIAFYFSLSSLAGLAIATPIVKYLSTYWLQRGFAVAIILLGLGMVASLLT